MPTFVDVRKSFGASELQEDNVVFQAAAAGRHRSLPSDTWLKLFQSSTLCFWCRTFSMSFNVKDLHTVDEGVRKHLMSHLKSAGLGLARRSLGWIAGLPFGVEEVQQWLRNWISDVALEEAVSTMMASNESFDHCGINRDEGPWDDSGDHGGGTSDETDISVPPTSKGSCQVCSTIGITRTRAPDRHGLQI